ncbi:MAG: hypothetical protein WBM04_13615 [Candidatus Korobacteraceae bacterium]
MTGSTESDPGGVSVEQWLTTIAALVVCSAFFAPVPEAVETEEQLAFLRTWNGDVI